MWKGGLSRVLSPPPPPLSCSLTLYEKELNDQSLSHVPLVLSFKCSYLLVRYVYISFKKVFYIRCDFAGTGP